MRYNSLVLIFGAFTIVYVANTFISIQYTKQLSNLRNQVKQVNKRQLLKNAFLLFAFYDVLGKIGFFY